MIQEKSSGKLKVGIDLTANCNDIKMCIRDRIYTQTWSGNARMLRCAKKLGFVECDRDVGALEIDGQKYDGLTFKINK